LTTLGTPRTGAGTRLLLLGAGELGKEVAIEAQRLGVEVIAVDRYPGAPAMQVAHRHHVIDMLDEQALRSLIEHERPDYVVPEVEAIATTGLLALEAAGQVVIPTARAAHLTMHREGIRRLAAEELAIATSPFRFADTAGEYRAAVDAIGLPCVVKPVTSSSGKGQSLVRTPGEVDAAWSYAQSGGRAGAGRVIVEGFIDFEYEITLLTIRHAGGTSFCEPIGHLQVDGDYRESWQPHPMSTVALERAQQVARTVTDALGGRGVFGVELFVRGEDVWFSEVSPRPHDTGMVTMISQDLSQFALHVRAILGLPIPNIARHGPSASCAILLEGEGRDIRYHGIEAALAEPDTALRLFGKPEVRGRRRMGVALARGATIGHARDKARAAAAAVVRGAQVG
jgi:phosphoribosylglycinamide formyltransferase 2